MKYDRTWSAGVLISLSAKYILMDKSASIGAAEPQPADEKYISSSWAENISCFVASPVFSSLLLSIRTWRKFILFTKQEKELGYTIHLCVLLV